jgi:hypothetical protein
MLFRAALVSALFAALMSCSGKKVEALPEAPKPASGETPSPVPEVDPRLAFESTGLLPEAGSPGSFELRLESRGRLEAGPLVLAAPSQGAPSPGLAYALARASLSKAAVATDAAGELLVLYRGGGAEALTVSPPSPVVGLASSGGRLVALLADGSALCYDAGLKELWRRPGAALLALGLPGGRFALAEGGEEPGSGKLSLLDSGEGKELWSARLPAPPRALAYAAGSVLAADASSLAAYSEADGHELMRQSLAGPARALAAGAGLAAVLEDSGEIEIRDSASGAPLSKAAGRHDRGIAPILDGGRLFAALAGEGSAAVEMDAKSGGETRLFECPGPLSFLAAGPDTVYGIRGGRLWVSPRREGEKSESLALPEAAASGLAAFEGGLFFVGRSGALFASRGPGAKGSAGASLGALLSPESQTAEAIASSLDRFRAREGTGLSGYLGFDLFVEGIPVEPGRSAFSAYRLEPEAARQYRISFESASGGGRVLLALFSSSGALIDSNFDDYGLAAFLDARLERGASYWIVTGRLDGLAEPYRLSLR